jgi:type II secretory pathway component PulF
MPEFAYIALAADGQRMQGTVTASDEDALAAILRTRDQYLVQAKPADDSIDLGEIRIFESVNRRDVIFFTTQLATIASTGVNLVEGLRGIEAQTSKLGMRKVIASITRCVEGGQSLSQALERHPDAFDELYVAIVRAGEATGHVDRALEDLAQQLEWQDKLASRVREAATYPLLVVGLLTVLMVVLVGFTIPRFAAVYQRVNPNLQMPLPTRIVQGFGMFVAGNWYVILAVLAVLYILFKLRVQTTEGSIWWSRLELKMPIIGEVTRKVALSRFAHYFGTLHESGLEVAPSLSLMERVLGNPYLSQRFRRAVQRVMAGESLSRSLAAVGEFSPIVIQMVALGETTGQMSKSLQQVRQYYDREVDATVNRALTMFGPVAIMVLAGVFVLIAVAFYLPLFNLAKAIQ